MKGMTSDTSETFRDYFPPEHTPRSSRAWLKQAAVAQKSDQPDKASAAALISIAHSLVTLTDIILDAETDDDLEPFSE